MDATTTDSIFKMHPESPPPVLRAHPSSLIRDPALVTCLLLDWRVLHKAGEPVTQLLFSSLELLVSGTHPHHSFNCKQMRAAAVVSKIFNIYLVS